MKRLFASGKNLSKETEVKEYMDRLQLGRGTGSNDLQLALFKRGSIPLITVITYLLKKTSNQLVLASYHESVVITFFEKRDN